MNASLGALSPHGSGVHRLVRLLTLPWRVLTLSGHWVVAFALTVDLSLAVSVRFFGLDQPLLAVGVLVAIGMAFIWFYLLPQTMALVHAAQALRLPHARREVQLSLFKYVLLTVLLPAAGLAVFGAPFTTSLLALVFAASAGWIVALLPSYAYYLLLLAYFVLLALSQMVPGSLSGLVPKPSSAEFPVLLAWLDPGMLLLAVARWWQLAKAPRMDSRLRRPIVFNLSRALGGRCRTTSLVADESEALKQRPNWLHPDVTLHAVGPRRIDLALRVALGSNYLPVTASTRLKQCALITCMLALVALFLLLVGASTRDGFLWNFFRQSGGWFLLFGCLIGSLSGTAILRQHWSRSNTELPLLALLPGLGHAQQVKRALLRVCLVHALKSWTILGGLSGLLLCWGAWDVSFALLAWVLLAAVFGLLLNLSQLLVLFGQLTIPWQLKWLRLGFTLVLSTVTLCYGLSVTLGAFSPSMMFTVLLGLGWLLLMVFMARDCIRGWRGMAALPHVFLTSKS